MSLTYKAFKALPFPAQNIAITLASINLYRVRRGGKFKNFQRYYSAWDNRSYDDVIAEQNRRLADFLKYSQTASTWFNKILKDYDLNSDNLSEIPLLEKKDIIHNFNQIKTIDEKDGLVNQTSGTTGAAMKTVMTVSDMQERWAIVDNYMQKHGFKFGKKTAWFSGKNLINETDIKHGHCSHYDFINKIRFYSTFHITNENFEVYWRSLSKFKPEFIVGFPTSLYQLCEIADSRGLKLQHPVNVFFSTSESLLPQHREVISKVLGCKVRNHYSASEGAPIIMECTAGNLHMHSLTGVFEVVDEDMAPALEGELIVTSFTSKGTPLIRYRVGDRISTDPHAKCPCGSVFPLVNDIDGRSNDFIYSPDRGRVNLVNMGNSAKGIKGIVCFQIIQNSKNYVEVLVVKTNQYTIDSEKRFKASLKERLGSLMTINIKYVDDIPREKGGKFRIIKNNLNLDEL